MGMDFLMGLNNFHGHMFGIPKISEFVPVAIPSQAYGACMLSLPHGPAAHALNRARPHALNRAASIAAVCSSRPYKHRLRAMLCGPYCSLVPPYSHNC